MQIGIDTDTNTIDLYGEVNLKELFTTLKNLGIDKEEWSIRSTAEPVIKYIHIPYEKPIPWIQPYRTSPWYGDIMCNNQMHSNVTAYNTGETTLTAKS